MARQKSISMAMCLAIGTALGSSLGVTVGAVIDNVGLGVALGPGFGASLGLAVYFVMLANQREPMTCPACGYSVRGLPSERCPECGRDFDPDEVAEEPDRGGHEM